MEGKNQASRTRVFSAVKKSLSSRSCPSARCAVVTHGSECRSLKTPVRCARLPACPPSLAGSAGQPGRQVAETRKLRSPDQVALGMGVTGRPQCQICRPGVVTSPQLHLTPSSACGVLLAGSPNPGRRRHHLGRQMLSVAPTPAGRSSTRAQLLAGAAPRGRSSTRRLVFRIQRRVPSLLTPRVLFREAARISGFL